MYSMYTIKIQLYLALLLSPEPSTKTFPLIAQTTTGNSSALKKILGARRRLLEIITMKSLPRTTLLQSSPLFKRYHFHSALPTPQTLNITSPTPLPRPKIILSYTRNSLPNSSITSIQRLKNSHITPPLRNRNIRQRNREENNNSG